jgi:hypothetical protein
VEVCAGTQNTRPVPSQTTISPDASRGRPPLRSPICHEGVIRAEDSMREENPSAGPIVASCRSICTHRRNPNACSDLLPGLAKAACLGSEATRARGWTSYRRSFASSPPAGRNWPAALPWLGSPARHTGTIDQEWTADRASRPACDRLCSRECTPRPI